MPERERHAPRAAESPGVPIAARATPGARPACACVPGAHQPRLAHRRLDDAARCRSRGRASRRAPRRGRQALGRRGARATSSLEVARELLVELRVHARAPEEAAASRLDEPRQDAHVRCPTTPGPGPSRPRSASTRAARPRACCRPCAVSWYALTRRPSADCVHSPRMTPFCASPWRRAEERAGPQPPNVPEVRLSDPVRRPR